MDFSNEDSVRLIELSILGVNDATLEFVTKYESVLKRCFNKYSKLNYFLEYSSYYSFVFERLLSKGKLLSLYRYLKANSLLDNIDESLSQVIESYFFTIAKSAFYDYLAIEYPGKKVINNARYTDSKSIIVPYIKMNYEDYKKQNNSLEAENPQNILWHETKKIQKIFQYLQSIKPEKRIPFWLTYLVREYPLSDNDIEWLAQINTTTNKIIIDRINHAITQNQTKSFAVSSNFLGDLLKCKTNTVTKRIERIHKAIKLTLTLKTEKQDV